jgi:hypothetical protein
MREYGVTVTYPAQIVKLTKTFNDLEAYKEWRRGWGREESGDGVWVLCPTCQYVGDDIYDRYAHLGHFVVYKLSEELGGGIEFIWYDAKKSEPVRMVRRYIATLDQWLRWEKVRRI